MDVILRFHVGGKFRYNPFRYENATVVKWKCGKQSLSYELLIWILGRMKVNNVGKLLFYKQWDKHIVDMDMDLILLQCEISFGMFVQLATEKGSVDLYVEHDESQPLFIEGKHRILPCDLLHFPDEIHATYFSIDTVELVDGSTFNIEGGVKSLGFPRHIKENAAPFSPFYNPRNFNNEFDDAGEEEAKGDRVVQSGNGEDILGSGDRIVEEEDGANEDNSEEGGDDEEYVGVERGLGTWVDVSYLSDDEEYRELRKGARAKKKTGRGENSGGVEGQGQDQDEGGNREEDINEAVRRTRNEDGGSGRPDLRQEQVDDEIGDDSEASALSTSSGSEAEHGRRRRKTSSAYKPTTNYREIPHFESGMIFLTRKQFKDAVIEHSLKVHREIDFVKNDKQRIRFKCLDKTCKWYAYCMKPKYVSHWQLRTLIPEHTCPRVFINSRINYKLIATHFIKERKSNAIAMKQKDIKTYSKEELGIEISESQARRARLQIIQHFCGDWEKEFRRIWDYAHELKDNNPGSTVVLEAPGNVFLRMYVCFDAVKKGFLAGCRQVLGVDGCFLKGPYRQQLLSVVGRDANDQMFPVAWAVVDVENNSNWIWFLEIVMKDLHITEGGLGWTFQSDQHPSIIHAFRVLMPKAETRRCARHLFSKWRKGRDGDMYSSLYWSVVKSTNLPSFEENVERLYNFDPDAVDDIFKVPPKFWCKNFFQCLSMSDVVDNNMCETFNAFISTARHLSIVKMFEEIRMLIVKRFVKMRIYGNCTFVGDYGPRIWAKIEDHKDASVYCHVFTNGDGGWEVFEGPNKYIVKFEERKCSCRVWDLTGIPCQHAVAVISHRRCKIEDFVAHWYSKDMFLKSYEYSIKPVNDERFRCKTLLPDIIAPPRKAVKGRRRVCRIPEIWEPKSRQKNPTKLAKSSRQRCILCFKTGHKSKTCSKHNNTNGGVTGESSQSESLSTQNSTTNIEAVQRRRNQFDCIPPTRPFAGIEAFIDTTTGMNMARQASTTVDARSRIAPVQHTQSSGPTRWFGGHLPTHQGVPPQQNVNETTSTTTVQQSEQPTSTCPIIMQTEKRQRGRPKGFKNKKHKPLP